MLEQTGKIDIHDLPIDAIGNALGSRKLTLPPTATGEPAPPPAVEVRTGADVFISYARENRSQADALARELRGRGWSVWWDRWIGLGRLFPNVIRRELAAARCVVVLWSSHSVRSGWVLYEAMVGHKHDILIPLRLEKVDLPFPFQDLQTADLFGDRYSQQLEECMKAIAIIVLPGPPLKVEEIDSHSGSTAASRGIFLQHSLAGTCWHIHASGGGLRSPDRCGRVAAVGRRRNRSGRPAATGVRSHPHRCLAPYPRDPGSPADTPHGGSRSPPGRLFRRARDPGPDECSGARECRPAAVRRRRRSGQGRIRKAVSVMGDGRSPQPEHRAHAHSRPNILCLLMA